MIIKFEEDFLYSLNEQVRYIAKDKPLAAKKFKIDLLKNLKKDLKQPFNFNKSIYFNNDTIRDYVFKGYKIVFYIDLQQKIIYVFGFIKYKDSL